MDFAWVLDTFFALFAFTLIILMVPGFAMLEAGLVRTKKCNNSFDYKHYDLYRS